MPPIAYTPPHFAETERERLLDFIRARTFGTLIAVLNGEAVLAHAPIVLGEGVLRFHLAKGNPFLEAARAGATGKAVFPGPDAYISPDWYVSENQVPTWNYAAVYVQGPMRMLSREEMIAQVDALSAGQEAKLEPKKPWTRAKMAPGFDERLFAAIEGVEMGIETLQGKFKLSQNKSPADVEGAARALETAGRNDVATLMRGWVRSAGQ
jgi:transcriptional regulator